MDDVNAPAPAPADPTTNLDAPAPVVEEKKPEGDKPEGDAPASDAKPEGAKPDGEGDDDDDGEGDAGQPDKPKSRWQRKNDELRRERERADRVERELAAERSRRGAPPTTEEGVKAVVAERVGAAPKESDYPDLYAFQDARAGYEAAKRVVEVQVRGEAKAAEAAHVAARDQRARDHIARVNEAKAELSDYDQVIEKATGKVHADPFVEELILESPDSGRLLYHLLKNPALVESLNALNAKSPRDAVREMGRIEAGLQRSATPKTTKAPAPITSPKGGAAPAPDPTRGPDEMADYVRWRKSKG